MKAAIEPGKYIVAVSGGVDSMVLLDILAHIPGLELVVAHFDHGIRTDSGLDRQLVERAAGQYSLPFVYDQGKLGPNTSEADARSARYTFLRRIKHEHNARAIITAHHQDDLIETAIINVLRGTGRKGLSSLRSTAEVLRPLLHVTKQQLYEYVRQHPDRNIIWNVDSTNTDDRYLRNYIRRHLIPELGPAARRLFLSFIDKAAESNPLIDSLLLHEINAHQDEHGLNRYWFVMLPYDVSCEAMATWLREQGIREFDRKLIERLVVAVKVAMPGKQADINAGYLLEVGKYGVKITPRSLSR